MEINQLLKLPTYFSSEFDDKIDEIIWYNQFEEEGRKQLKDELETILSHISNRAIALSYSDGGREDINRTIFKIILGHNVAYKIVADNDFVSICIENIEFNVEDYGLKAPPTLGENKKVDISRIIKECIKHLLNEDEEYVSVTDFNYDGKELYSVGDGDSFCYLPCDIYGTPKLYYADCHFSCALQSLEDIIHSFYKGNIVDLIDEDDIHNIAEELWLDCISEPGRVFYKKYIVVGFDGHIPSCEYVQDVIEYLGGNPSNYCVAYNDGDSVKEIPCNYFLAQGINGKEKPTIMKVPREVKLIYDNIHGKRNAVDRKFPMNMTRAEYYWLTRQENKSYDKVIIEVINQYLKQNLILN